MKRLSTRLLVITFTTGSIGIIMFLLYAMVVASLNNWTVKLNFNNFGEAIAELAVLSFLVVVGLAVLSRARISVRE